MILKMGHKKRDFGLSAKDCPKSRTEYSRDPVSDFSSCFLMENRFLSRRALDFSGGVKYILKICSRERAKAHNGVISRDEVVPE